MRKHFKTDKLDKYITLNFRNLKRWIDKMMMMNSCCHLTNDHSIHTSFCLCDSLARLVYNPNKKRLFYRYIESNSSLHRFRSISISIGNIHVLYCVLRYIVCCVNRTPSKEISVNINNQPLSPIEDRRWVEYLVINENWNGCCEEQLVITSLMTAHTYTHTLINTIKRL